VTYPGVFTAMLPKIEMDAIGRAPAMAAVFGHGAWVHTVGAGEAGDDRQDRAWAGVAASAGAAPARRRGGRRVGAARQ
jgi:hypothetical protein